MLEQRAVALDPRSPIASAYLVLIYLDMDDVSRAKPLVSSMIERWPDDLFSNAAAAVTHESLGDNDAAARHARQALTAYPKDPLSLAVLRNADLRRGDLKPARARYASTYPDLLGPPTPRVDVLNLSAAIDLALVLQKTGELDRALAVLDAGEKVVLSLPRLGLFGYGIADAQVHALRGDKSKALDALREAEQAGWRGPLWRYYRDIDPNLASLRNEPEFKAVFADIERDMAQQRARLAARPKDAPLELTDASR
jgi:tetratricopeptide (TPR) repeat protein